MTALSKGHFKLTVAVGAVQAAGQFNPGVTRQSNVEAPETAGSWANCREDGSISVEICTQIWYDVLPCAGVNCYTITKAANTYYNVDPHDAVIVQGEWVESVFGKCHYGCATGYYSGSHSFGWHNVSSGAVYSNGGWWNGAYTEVFSGASEQRGGTSYLHWDYRGRPYTFQVQTLLPN